MHMSNLHGKFIFADNRFFYEDQQSTNGSWMKLSDEGQKSQLFLLEEDTVFKIGNAAMYQVGFEKEKTKPNVGNTKNIPNQQADTKCI